MMDRRDFLRLSAALGLSGLAVEEGVGAETAGRVASEVGKLKKVIVHPPGAETLKSFPLMQGGHSMLTWELLRERAAEQHAAFVEALRHAGAEVLFVERLVDEAIEQARQRGAFQDWIEQNVPRLTDYEKEVTAGTLFGRDDRFIYQTDSHGNWRHATDAMTTMFFTRDIAVATPRGVVLGNYHNSVRSFETKLLRFAFTFAPTLQGYPIVFDAAHEGIALQGGDLMVADEQTLFLGVGNSTEELAASRLARKLEMDVVAVQMPSARWLPGEWEGLQLIFYHLDCLFNLVDWRTALAVPYLLEEKWSDRNPLLEVLDSFASYDPLNRAGRHAMLGEVRDVGWVKRYKAGSGERDDQLPRTKLVDYLRSQGFDVVYVGGEPRPGESSHKHVIERVVRESRFMAVNVVAVEPGKVISYSGTPHTLNALRDAGVDVVTFPSDELARANGGPHCLSLPLERA